MSFGCKPSVQDNAAMICQRKGKAPPIDPFTGGVRLDDWLPAQGCFCSRC